MQVGEGHATPVGITGVLRGAVGVGVGVVVQVINGAEQMAPRMGDGWWAGGGCSGAEQCRSVRGVRLRSTTPQGRGVALLLLMGLDGCARAWGRVMPGSSAATVTAGSFATRGATGQGWWSVWGAAGARGMWGGASALWRGAAAPTRRRGRAGRGGGATLSAVACTGGGAAVAPWVHRWPGCGGGSGG